MKWCAAGGALGAVMALGCAGMMVYGKEQSAVTAQPGTPCSLNYQAADGEPHNLWLDYSVAYGGGDYSVTGPITATSGGNSLGSWTMNLSREGSPVSGGRFVINSTSSSTGAQGNAKATIFLVELPAQPTGTAVTVAGTFSAGAGTTVHNLRLVVTD